MKTHCFKNASFSVWTGENRDDCIVLTYLPVEISSCNYLYSFSPAAILVKTLQLSQKALYMILNVSLKRIAGSVAEWSKELV